MLNASKLATKYILVAGAAILLPACASSPQTSSANVVSHNDYRDAIGVYSDPIGDEGMDPIANGIGINADRIAIIIMADYVRR